MYLSLSISLFLLLALANLTIHLCFLEKFDATSLSTIACCHTKWHPSLFIHEKRHPGKGLFRNGMEKNRFIVIIRCVAIRCSLKYFDISLLSSTKNTYYIVWYYYYGTGC